MKISKETKEWIIDLSAAVLCALLLMQFIQPNVVLEHSMENTLEEKDYIFVSKQSYKLFGGTPQYGDIVILKSDLTTSNGKNKRLIKRVIATEGDTISIHNGIVYLNGAALDEPYTKDGYTYTEMDEVTVPEGNVFVMGDNRQNSADSRDSRIGFVDEKLIIGKAVFRLFPLSKAGSLYE